MILPSGLELQGALFPEAERVLTAETLDFLIRLSRAFEPARQRLLKFRRERQADFDAGEQIDFLPTTQAIRAADWKIGPVQRELTDRRVELVTTLDRAALVDALNSGAKVCVADFEDFTSPTWENLIRGQANLMDAARRTITAERHGNTVGIPDRPPLLMVRPRGLHLTESHLTVDGNPISAALFDFGTYLFHNARELLKRGGGPYFYLPKLESHLEARLWNDVFRFSQDAVGIPLGTIKATVIIETVPAAMEMDEILYELKDHSAGLACGSWDYVASFIRYFRQNSAAVLPERASLNSLLPFIRTLHMAIVRTCHRRGAHAIGSTSAQLPVRGQATATEAAVSNVYTEKRREAEDGFDGSSVAHPGLVTITAEAFEKVMPERNQIHRHAQDASTPALELLQVPTGPITEEGARKEIRVALLYLREWLSGNGQVIVDDVLENSATVELARSQLWQWTRHCPPLLDERPFTRELFDTWLDQTIAQIAEEDAKSSQAESRASLYIAAELLRDITTGPELFDFWTERGYAVLNSLQAEPV